MNLDETCFLCNEGELSIIGGNNKTHHDKKCSDSRFSITLLRVGSTVGVNVIVIFLSKATKVHQMPRGKNLVIKYGLPEGFCVIPNKAVYMDDKTWEKVVKVVAPSMTKMAVRNVAFVCSIYFLLF